MNSIIAVIEKASENWYTVSSDNLLDCIVIGDGISEHEAKEDFFTSLKEMKESFAMDDRNTMQFDKEVKFYYAVKSFFPKAKIRKITKISNIHCYKTDCYLCISEADWNTFINCLDDYEEINVDTDSDSGNCYHYFSTEKNDCCS